MTSITDILTHCVLPFSGLIGVVEREGLILALDKVTSKQIIVFLDNPPSWMVPYRYHNNRRSLNSDKVTPPHKKMNLNYGTKTMRLKLSQSGLLILHI